jgi:oxygen-dependent protoporphyrinogen oxidase
MEASGARYNLFVAPKRGMSSIVSALASRLAAGAIRLNTCVKRIQRGSDDTWAIVAGGGTELFDAVIIALPSHAASRLLAPVDTRLAAELGTISYSGCAAVSCGYRREQIANPIDGFGFVVPQIEGRRIIAASFASNKFPGRAPEGRVLIRTFVGGSLQPERLKLSDDDLRRLVIDEVADLLAVTGLPQWIDIARWPDSMPQYEVGHLDRVSHIERLAARWPRLALAGNAYHGVGVPQCIASGEAAAERVVAKWKTDWSRE